MKIRQGLRLYLLYISINIRSMMQYKASFFFATMGQFLVSFGTFLGVYFMFQRFPQVKGFSYREIVFCFSMVLLEFSIAEMYARGFDSFSGMVRMGEFDRVLVRPRGEVLQVLGSKFELTRIGRLLQAIVMFVYGINLGDVRWSPAKIATVIFMLIGGIALFTGIFFIYAALCFFTLEGLEVINVFTNGAVEYGKYPAIVYGKKMLLFTTFVVPYALVQYYPLLYILDRTANPIYMLLPLVAVLFLIPCYGLWRFGVRHYKSSGS